MTKPRADIEALSCHEMAEVTQSSLVCEGCKFSGQIDQAVQVYADENGDWATQKSVGKAVIAMGCEGPGVESVESECGRSYIKSCPNLVVRLLIDNHLSSEQ